MLGVDLSMDFNFNENQNYGYSNIRLTKGMVLSELRTYVSSSTNTCISKEERLEETPNTLRHACAYNKVSFLPIMYFNLPAFNFSTPYFYCSCCGKLYYPKDFL